MVVQVKLMVVMLVMNLVVEVLVPLFAKEYQALNQLVSNHILLLLVVVGQVAYLEIQQQDLKELHQLFIV